METEFIQRGQKRFYEDWMEKEGIPVYQAFGGVADLTELPRRPWARLGGFGTFVELEGTKQGWKLLYVAEISAGGTLEPEKHLYRELIYVMRGRGVSEVWHDGESKRTFEWGEGSLFAVPPNVWHRLVSGSREPVLLFAQTNAPAVMETFQNTEFVFNCDYKFTERYAGEADYFVVGEKRTYTQEGLEGEGGQRLHWETNFVPDVRSAFLGDHLSPHKVEGGRQTNIIMRAWAGAWGSGGFHTSEWPVGKYHKAHYHGPEAVLLGLRSEGYVLLWHVQYGPHPFRNGHGDKVMKVPWKPNAIYSPPNEWFHQHFNTGSEPARHLAVFGGVGGLPSIKPRVGVRYGPGRSVREGGRLIEYEDEDPEIRRMFEEALREKGIECTMPPVVYRADPFEFHF